MNGPHREDDPVEWKRFEMELRKWAFWPRTGFGTFQIVVQNNRLKEIREGGVWLRPG